MNVKINKTCSCGKPHPTMPDKFRLMDEDNIFDGAWFECSCGSTMFVPKVKLEPRDWLELKGSAQ